MGGETCGVTPAEHRSDCPTALLELARFHFTTINSGFYLPDLDRWKTEGCYDEIDKRLGYRLQLVTASLPKSVKPGGRFVLDVDLANTGFGALYNPRPVFVVLEGAGARYQAELTKVDPRQWSAGKTSAVSAHLELPAGTASGMYTLALWLPDAAKSLAPRAEYAVRLANVGVWNDAAGYNELGKIEVSPTAPGASNLGATELSVLP